MSDSSSKDMPIKDSAFVSNATDVAALYLKLQDEHRALNGLYLKLQDEHGAVNGLYLQLQDEHAALREENGHLDLRVVEVERDQSRAGERAAKLCASHAAEKRAIDMKVAKLESDNAELLALNRDIVSKAADNEGLHAVKVDDLQSQIANWRQQSEIALHDREQSVATIARREEALARSTEAAAQAAAQAAAPFRAAAAVARPLGGCVAASDGCLWCELGGRWAGWGREPK